MPYRFRYFFDAGSGTCLWSADEPTKMKFDYPVAPGTLPITQNLKRDLDDICAWYDTSMNWENPPGPGPWSEAEQHRFQQKSAELLEKLRNALGSDFEIIDERTR